MFCVVDVSLVRRVEGKLLLLEVVAWEEMVSVIEIRILFCRRDAQQVIDSMEMREVSTDYCSASHKCHISHDHWLIHRGYSHNHHRIVSPSHERYN